MLRCRSIWGIAAIGAAIFLGTTIQGVGVALADSPVAVGAARLTRPDGSATLASGASGTPFDFTVPSGSHCRQDSTKGTVLYSFLVPKGFDIAAVTYRAEFASIGYFLADPGGTPLYGVNVAKTTAAIYNLPTFSWEGLLLSHVPLHGAGGLIDPTTPHPGVWEAGVACTYGGHIQDYWRLDVTFFAKGASDFTWSTNGRAPSSSEGSPAGIVAGLAGAAVVTLGFVVMIRMRRMRSVGRSAGVPS